MDWFQVLFSALLINTVAAISLKCGEDIVIRRGEKKVLRFWSSEDELLNVDVLSMTKNATDAETNPLREGQGEADTANGTVSSNTHAGSGSSSGTTSNTVRGASESNKFRTDIGTSNTDNDVREENNGNEFYYSYKPNITSQHDEIKVNEDHQEVTSSPAFDQTNTPKFEEIHNPSNDQIPEKITEIPPVIEVSTLKNETEQQRDQEKLGNELPEISASTEKSDDENQTVLISATTESILESISSNLHRSDHENQFTEKEDMGNVPGNTHTVNGDKKLDNEDSGKNNTFLEHNQGGSSVDLRTTTPDITDYFEVVTNPNVLISDRNGSHHTQEDELPVFTQTTEENNDHTESQTQSNLDKLPFDSINYDGYAVPYTTYGPWDEQRQEHGSLGNILPEILDIIQADIDNTQTHNNIPTKTESISSNVQEQREKNKITGNEASELNFPAKTQIRDSGYSETTFSIIMSDLETVTNPNVFSLHRDGISDTKEDRLPGFPPIPEDNNRNKFHHIASPLQSEPERTHLDSVSHDEDTVESTTFGIWTEVRQGQQNTNNKIIPEKIHSQQKNDQMENSQQILNTNTEIPDLLTTRESFISTYPNKGTIGTLFLEPEAFDTTTIYYRKIFDDKILRTTVSPLEYSEVTEEQMMTTGISIGNGLTKIPNHSSLNNLDSSSEVSTTNPMNSDENETENPFLVNENILYSEDKNDSMALQNDIFTQQTIDRLIPVTESVTQGYDDKIKKDPENIVTTERENEAAESGTEITGINDQNPTEINSKIKMGDPLVSENILFRMDELDILNEDSTTYNINEDIYNGEAPVVTTEIMYQTTDKYIETTTITAHDKNEHTKHASISNDETNGNEEGNMLVTHANKIHDFDNLSNLTMKKNESDTDLINENILASENNTDRVYTLQESTTESSVKNITLQESTTESSVKNIQNDEEKLQYLPTTSKDIDDEVTEASVKHNNKETDEVKWENNVESDIKKKVPETEKPIVEQSNQENQTESDTDKISSTTSSYISVNNSFINSATEKSTPVTQNNKLNRHTNKVINPIATIPKNPNIKSDESKFNGTSESLQHPDKNVIGDKSTTPLVITTTKPKTTTEIDIFASIIERWTEALENIPDETLSIEDLAIDVSDFLDVKPDSSIEVIDTVNKKLAEDLFPETRDPLLPVGTESINDKDKMGTTEKDFLDHIIGLNSSAMAGFMNTSFTQDLEVPYTTTQDTSFSFTDPITVIETSTEKGEVTKDSQNKHLGNMNSEHLNEPMDFLTITDNIYYQTTEADSTIFSTVNLDQIEITTINTPDDQTPELKSKESEKSSQILTTIAPSSEENIQIEMHEIKSDTEISARDELDEISEDFFKGKPIEKLTTSFPNEEITESDIARNGNTTPFTIPLSVLKNPTMLDNILNGQVKNGGSKVVIKEQGSKVAISSPSQNDVYQPQAFSQESISDVPVTASSSATTKAYDQTTTYFPAKWTTEAINQDNEQFTTEEIRELHEKNSSTLNVIHQLNNEHSTENPLKVDDMSISNSALNEYLNIENLIHKNPDSYLTSYESTFYPQVDESYNYEYNEDTVENTATTSIPDTSARESTEPSVDELFYDETYTVTPHSSETITISFSSNSITDLENYPHNSTVHLMHPTVSLDEIEVSLVNNQESQNLSLTEHQQAVNLMGNYITTTTQSETEESGDDPNLATIIIPPSIVNGLHGGHIKNDQIYSKTDAPITKISKMDTTTETTTTEVTEMDHTTEAAVTVVTGLLQNGNSHITQHTGVISRKEDEGQTDYGGSSPFFIRLPGSPDPVPVYIQYEPVEINYVPTNGEELNIDYRDSLKNNDKLEITNLFRDNIGALNSVTEYANLATRTDNGSYESFSNNSHYAGLKSNETDFFAVNTTNSSEIENITQNIYNEGINLHKPNDTTTKISSQHQEHQLFDDDKDSDQFRPNKPILKSPDPFFVMEAPKLGNEEEDKNNHSDLSLGNNSYSKVQINQSEDRYSVDVSSQYGFTSSTYKEGQPGRVEDVPLGINKEILYPGDYYLHDSYTDVNLKLLRNPVFSLRPKVNTPSPEDLLSPQYTPFPITTNPPRRKPTASSITALPLFTSLGSTSTNTETMKSNLLSDSDLPKVSNNSENYFTSEEPAVTTQRHPPSIEYSPIPAVDFDDSYALSFNPDSIFANEESIIAPYVHQFKGNFGHQEGTDQRFAEKIGQLDNGNSYSSDTYQAQNTEAHISQNISPNNPTLDPITTDNLPIPSDQFMAHKQVWSFPISREDPAHLRSAAHIPGKYKHFHSPLEIPGTDPEYFSSRKIPAPVSSKDTDSSPGKYDGHVIVDFQSEYSRPTYEDEVMDADSEVGYETPTNDHENFHPSWQGNDTFQNTQHEVVFGPQFFTYLNNLPDDLLRKFLNPEGERLKRSVPAEGEQIFCEWNIRTEPGLYLLMTFHNLSAAYTVDCHGAYIEVERENNGYDARWCGNRVGQAGTRPHVIFAKTEVRITVYDDGRGNKVMPTGFEADIEVIDLFNKSDYRSFMRSNAYPHIRRLLLG